MLLTLGPFLAYLALGVLSGFSAGLLGVGGGLIIVPILMWLFLLQGFSEAVVVHMAIGTSLATIVVTSISSVMAHHRKKAILWRVVTLLVPGIMLGALVSGFIAEFLPTAILAVCFGLFELMVAAQLWLQVKPAAHRRLPSFFILTPIATLIGGLSGLLGIGGGTMTVPLLLRYQVAMPRAIATAAACGLPIAIFGTISFMLFGGNSGNLLPANTIGYVYWPAFLAIIMTSVLFAPVGAKKAHQWPVVRLKRVFAICLLCLGIMMLLK